MTAAGPEPFPFPLTASAPGGAGPGAAVQSALRAARGNGQWRGRAANLGAGTGKRAPLSVLPAGLRGRAPAVFFLGGNGTF